MSVINHLGVGREVYGVIYGKGVVSSIYTDSFYTFEVTYDNDVIVPYTEDGVPGWGLKLGLQTVFNVEDIDLMEYDISPVKDVMTMKKLTKGLKDNTLETKCPSGIWCEISDVPETLLESYVMSGKLHLFRRVRNVKHKK